MEKLLHERLRDFCEACPYSSIEDYVNAKTFRTVDVISAIADEIERYYIPRPRFEDGEPVLKGCETEYGTVSVVCVSDFGYEIYDSDGDLSEEHSTGEFVKRPTPKVCDADGVEIKVGDTVWNINNGCEHEVIGLPRPGCYQSVEIRNATTGSKGGIDAPLLTHERSVFDAEGVRICKGDTVWGTLLHDKHEVSLVKNGCVYLDDGSICFESTQLTHREPDSSENIREDARKLVQSIADKYEDGELRRLKADRAVI